MSASKWKVYISNLSVSDCGPRCIPPVTANPMGLSQSISTEPQSSGALPLHFSLTGQHANPFTQGRLDSVEGVTRAEVNGTNLGRGPQCPRVSCSCELAGQWKLRLHATQSLKPFGRLLLNKATCFVSFTKLSARSNEKIFTNSFFVLFSNVFKWVGSCLRSIVLSCRNSLKEKGSSERLQLQTS